MMMDQQVNSKIVNKLNDLNLTISTCESMTGGAVASNLVLIEHASKCFLGSLVTYNKFTKIQIAKVKNETIEKFGTISHQCANEMALNCQKIFNSDIAISVTGNSSFISPIENKKSGVANICIVLFDKIYDFKFETKFNNRIDVINECVAFVYTKLWDLIKYLK